MKKFISILLALVMTLSLSTVAFADGHVITSVSEDNTQEIEATTTMSGDVFDRAAIEYNVRIEWTVTPGITTVKGGKVYKWDPNNLQYVEDFNVDSRIQVLSGADLPLGQTDQIYTNVEITVTNNSNADVDFTIGYNDAIHVDDNEYIETSERPDGSDIERTNGEDLNVHTLTRADSDYVEAGVVTAIDGRTDVYKLNEENFPEPLPEVQADKKTYKGAIWVTDIQNYSNFNNGDTIAVGTYTVTLMASTGVSEG